MVQHTRMLRTVSLGVASLAMLVSVVVSQVYAADDTQAPRDSIVLSPSSQRFAIKAGQIQTSKLTVVNDGSVDETFVVYSRPYSVKNEQYDPDFDHTSANTDIYQWVQFDKTSYTVAAGKTLEVSYRIQVPASAAPGGHYGVIFVETQPSATSTDSVMRKKRVGDILQATVEGTAVQKGQVVSSDATFWQTVPPLTATSRVQNSGNTDFQANTVLTVKDVFGKVKYQLAKDYTVYPGTTRKIALSWTNAPWFGLFHVEQTITVLGQTSHVSNLVLIAPRWLPAVLVLIIVAGVVYGLVRRRRT